MTVRLLHYSDIENAYDDPERIGRLAEFLNQQRDDALLCCTGDTTAPGLLSMETNGRHVLPFVRAVRPDYATFGNHEFDNGVTALRQLIEETPQVWLTANLRDASGERFGADEGVREWAIERIGGRRIGLVGVTDPQPIRENPLAVTAADPLPAVRDAVSTLRDHGVDAIVVLSHAGRLDDRLAEVPGVDAVLGGHVHDRRVTDVRGTPVVHPGERGEAVGEVRLASGSGSAVLHDVSGASADQQVVAAYRDQYERLGLSDVVVRLETPVRRGRSECYPESAVGNALVDAFRATVDADVAVCNAKMLRAGPPLSGEVTEGELRSMSPFDNTVEAVRLNGAELLDLFESLAAPPPTSVDLEVFAHVSGAELTWHRTDTGLTLVSATVGGRSIDCEELYTVAAPTFDVVRELFPPLCRDRKVGTHGGQNESLVEYVRENGFPVATGRRMRVQTDTASAEVYSLR